jgi:hypothetical protein
MGLSSISYPEWKAPTEDGQSLIWPEPQQILSDVESNQKTLGSNELRIQNVPLAELRREMRSAIGHEDAHPLIVDGHQTELYHAGVWVKSVLGDIAASRLGGNALHIAVDTDAPKHLMLRWLDGAKLITDDPRVSSVHWSGALKAPSPVYLEQLKGDLAAARFQQPPMIARFLELLPSDVDLASAVMKASRALDAELGLNHDSTLASPLWQSRPFLVFAHHLIARAGVFAAAYNAALADYRREKKVRTPTRPMPDLASFEASVELPLWLDELSTGNRIRPSVFAAEGGYLISHASGAEFHFDPDADGFAAADRLGQWLANNQLRLSPRALALTMFVRLCLADMFIHGIGGGRYDQVTDRVFASFFNIDPPRFCVTTATMYLPEAQGQQRICVPCIEREGHKLRHSLLGLAKQTYLQRIAAAPRCSPERYEAFTQMHRELATAVKSNPAIERWQRRLEDAHVRETAEAVIFDRELFYPMQPRERLEQMIARYRDRFASAHPSP